MEARSRTAKARRDRREDLRKKILAGAVALAKAERGEIEEGGAPGMDGGGLTRTEDRALFGLADTREP